MNKVKVKKLRNDLALFWFLKSGFYGYAQFTCIQKS